MTRQDGFRPSRCSADHGFESLECSAEHGFTLVELLVSLAIFALIAGAGVSLLGYSVGAQAAAAARLDNVAGLRRAGALLAADLAQAAPRVSRNADGAPEPAFLGGTGEAGAPAMRLVRGGWSNDAGERRSSLQKIEYRLVEGVLERQVWPMVDGAEPLPPAPILSGVNALTLRYRDRADWRDRWDSERPEAMPQAVEVTIELAGLGPVRQLFVAGTGN